MAAIGIYNLLPRTQKAVKFINTIPINHLAQHKIQPDTHTAFISFSELMCYVHIRIFFNEFVKGFMRQLVNIGQRLLKKDSWGELKIIFGNIDITNFPCKVVNILKKSLMNVC